MRKLRLAILALLLIVSFTFFVYAEEDKTYGEILMDLGFISGNGSSADEWSPITREQMVTMVNKLYSSENAGLVGSKTSTFTDHADAAVWAIPHIEYAKDKGLTVGKGAGSFGYKNKLSYQEAVTFVMKTLDESVNWSTVIEDAKLKRELESLTGSNAEVMLREYVFELFAKALMQDNVYGVPMLEKTGRFSEAQIEEFKLAMAQKGYVTSNEKADSEIKYGDKLFVNTTVSDIPKESLKTLEKNTYFTEGNVELFRFPLIQYKKSDPNIYADNSGMVRYFGWKGYLDAQHDGGWTFQMSHDSGPLYTEYTEYEMKEVLDGISMLVSNAFGSESEVYHSIIDGVYSAINGEGDAYYWMLPVIDGELEHRISLTQFNGTPQAIVIDYDVKPANLNLVKERSEVPTFDDQYVKFSDLNLTYEDLETDISKYPELMNSFDEDKKSIFYKYYAPYRGQYYFDDSSFGLDDNILTFHSMYSGEKYDYSHTLILGLGRGTMKGLRFEHYTNAEVKKAINMASAYIYHQTSPEVHKEVMKTVFDYMNEIHLVPLDLPYSLEDNYENYWGYDIGVDFSDRDIPSRYEIRSCFLSFLPSRPYMTITIRDLGQ